ncbi:universal stress protein [Klenkia terrae]|uniref:universal stress protein n=1 Tax=Klenkia terrae TaxID=1052259 RepID=UPI003617DAD7
MDTLVDPPAAHRHGHLPLAVVGATRLTVPSTGNESPGPSPYVVVSADVTTLGSALQLAFPAARRRCLPLDVVCVVTTDSPADMEGVCGSAEDAQEHASRWCQLAVEPWVARYPDVPVRLRIEQGDPASVLLSATRGAALLVIGTRQHTLTGHSTGPTHRVLRKATCPSLVAPPLHLDVQPPQRRLFRFIDDPKASQAHQ